MMWFPSLATIMVRSKINGDGRGGGYSKAEGRGRGCTVGPEGGGARTSGEWPGCSFFHHIRHTYNAYLVVVHPTR